MQTMSTSKDDCHWKGFIDVANKSPNELIISDNQGK